MQGYDDDEQQAQKRNGRNEALQTQNAELKNQVLELTKENNVLQEKLNVALVTGTSGACDDLKTEFINLCHSHSTLLGMSADIPLNSFNDQIGIMVLTNVNKALQKMSATNNHTRSSTAGSRMTTGTHKMDNEEMLQRIASLEDELHTALLSAEDIRLLKNKLMSLVDRARIDKERLLKAESESAFAKKRMEMLRDHLEKLMTHLKHEAAAKVRSQEQLRVKERELYKVEENARIIQRKSSAKDRLVLELREGSKILEDQLRLMDEKYLELRSKLDWARENGDRKVKQAQAQAKALRVKFALLNGGSGSLDKIQLPSLSMDAGNSLTEGSSTLHLDYFTNGAGPEGSYVSNGPGTNKSSHSKASKKGIGLNTKSIESIGSYTKPPTLDGVMEKIRKHGGGKNEWTDSQLRELAKSR